MNVVMSATTTALASVPLHAIASLSLPSHFFSRLFSVSLPLIAGFLLLFSVDEKAGPIIRDLNGNGQTAFCLLSDL